MGPQSPEHRSPVAVALRRGRQARQDGSAVPVSVEALCSEKGEHAGTAHPAPLQGAELGRRAGQ